MNEHKKRHNKPVANTAKRVEKTREITATCSKHVKTKRVLSESWQSWAQHSVAKDEDKKHEEDNDDEDEGGKKGGWS